jgi:hypothetical protein
VAQPDEGFGGGISPPQNMKLIILYHVLPTKHLQKLIFFKRITPPPKINPDCTNAYSQQILTEKLFYQKKKHYNYLRNFKTDYFLLNVTKYHDRYYNVE